MSSVTTAMCSEPPFLGSTFTMKVTPGRVRNSRRSPSFAARINGVGLAATGCSTEIPRAASAPQTRIEETPIARRTYRIIPLPSSRLHVPRRAFHFFPLLLPTKNCFPHALHRSLRHLARFLRTRVQNFQHLFRVLLVLHSSLPHRRDPLDQILGHGGFALDATDSCGRAPLPHP